MSLVFNALKKWHTFWLRKRLQQYGLQYHDLLTEGPILDTVLARMPQDMQETRERRIRRAFDLSLKKKYLPESEWVDPFQEVETYDKLLSQAQIETDERKHMNDEYWNTMFSMDKWYSYETDKVWFWDPEVLSGKDAVKKLEGR